MVLPFSRRVALGVLGALGLISAGLSAPAKAQARKPNFLFIAVDDLNHWVGPLGRNPVAKTPNLDRLARLGLTFTRAYCAAPVCNPSRAALLSGRRPSTSGVYDNGIAWKPRIPTGTTLPAVFKQAGYWVGGAGKLFHGSSHKPEEWSEYARSTGPFEREGAAERGRNGNLPFAKLNGDDSVLEDYQTAAYTVEQLGKKRDQPFFLACGIYRPHLPWNVPKKYFDLYPLDQIPLPPHKEGDLDDLPPTAKRWAHSMKDHEAIMAAGGEPVWKKAMQAYLASISYADGQIGRVLDALEKSPERENTIVVLWGDHGWHLGEKEHWRKFALWEEATRVPLFMVAPRLTTPGARCERTVDLMSLFPTLCDLAGILKPEHVEGHSLRPLLKSPKSAWKRPALTTFGFQNHAVRTERWRYIRYADGGEELYDHSKDPYEWTNLAPKPELAKVKAELALSFPKGNVPQPGKDQVPGE